MEVKFVLLFSFLSEIVYLKRKKRKKERKSTKPFISGDVSIKILQYTQFPLFDRISLLFVLFLRLYYLSLTVIC